MKFGIIGAGAMGCMMGSFLARAREDVWLMDIWEEHVSHINNYGLTVTVKGKTDIVPIRATTNTKDVGICDAVIIFTKCHYTGTAIQNALCMIDDDTMVMTIQNGIGNAETIAEFVNERQIIFGLTMIGSVIKGPGKIEIQIAQDEGATYVWPLVGEPDDRVGKVIDTFNQAGMNFHLSPDIRERIWRKLCLNAGTSTPIAISRLKNDDFINQPSSLELIRGLVFEIVAVANKEGIALNAEKEYEDLVAMIKRAPDHFPSALIDVLNHRKTEIDCLNGAVVARAKRYGMEAPYNATIYHLMKTIENTYDNIQHRVG